MSEELKISLLIAVGALIISIMSGWIVGAAFVITMIVLLING